MNITAVKILEFLNTLTNKFEYIGREDLEVHSFSSWKSLKDNSITWLRNIEDYSEQKISERNKLIIILPMVANKIKTNDKIGVIYCDNPKAVFFKILNHFFVEQHTSFVSDSAIILTDKIGFNVSIGHHSFINKNVEIGNNVSIGNHVSIECPTKIGDNTIIHSGTVIGTDGFGYYEEDNIFYKVPHFGGVHIGCDVEIGANTCIDRGTMDDTFIGDYVKIDNLCHIAHNVQIMDKSTVIALSLLGGSTILEENTYIAPGATVKNQVVIGKNSLVGMGAVVTKDVGENEVVAGVPAKTIKKKS